MALWPSVLAAHLEAARGAQADKDMFSRAHRRLRAHPQRSSGGDQFLSHKDERIRADA